MPLALRFPDEPEPISAAEIADAVRAELAVELSRLDVAVSTAVAAVGGAVHVDIS